MLIDIHTHVWDLEKQADEDFFKDIANSDAADPDNPYALPEDNWRDNAQHVDKAIVFGLKGIPSGIDVPDEYVAAYVAQHPEKLIGFMSLDPIVGYTAVAAMRSTRLCCLNTSRIVGQSDRRNF